MSLANVFLGAIVKSRKAAINFCMFACPSVLPHGITGLPPEEFSLFIVNLVEHNITNITDMAYLQSSEKNIVTFLPKIIYRAL